MINSQSCPCTHNSDNISDYVRGWWQVTYSSARVLKLLKPSSLMSAVSLCLVVLLIACGFLFKTGRPGGFEYPSLWRCASCPNAWPFSTIRVQHFVSAVLSLPPRLAYGMSALVAETCRADLAVRCSCRSSLCHCV
jgi:hypothetical protein